jgi:hypothetical protein
MLDAIQKLLILQDRDRRIQQLDAELATLGPLKESALNAAASARARAEAARQRVLHLESDRKKLELEVTAKQELIQRYSLQQYQTKKNEEYRALTHEIQTCRDTIRQLEDQQLDLMEQSEIAQRAALEAAQTAQLREEEQRVQLTALEERETHLRRQRTELLANREELTAAVDPTILPRYERLRKSKGDRVVVGIEHGACGGCHVKLPAQVIIGCRAAQEVVTCPNCGRILYFTSDMDMVVAD